MSNFVYIDTDGLEKAKVIQTGDLPAGLENVQSDWNQTNNAEADYIKNKPNVITTADGLNNGDMLYWNGSAWKVTTKLKYISTLLYTSLAFLVQNDSGVKKFQVDNSTNGIDIFDSGGTYYLRIKKKDGTGHTTLVFPADNGVSGQVLVTDGSGNLSWQNLDNDGWQRKNSITDLTPFNNDIAEYIVSWETATYSKNWDSSITRSTTDRLKNTGSVERLIRDNCFFTIMTNDLDLNGATICKAELFFDRYDSNNGLIERVLLDWDAVLSTGGVSAEWIGANLRLHGDIEYTLGENEYSKIWIKVSYDGISTGIQIEGYHEHEIINI